MKGLLMEVVNRLKSKQRKPRWPEVSKSRRLLLPLEPKR